MIFDSLNSHVLKYAFRWLRFLLIKVLVSTTVGYDRPCSRLHETLTLHVSGIKSFPLSSEKHNSCFRFPCHAENQPSKVQQIGIT